MSDNKKPLLNFLDPHKVEPRRYNPSRDIAYVFPSLMKAAVDSVAAWADDPINAEFIQKSGVTQEQVLKVLAAFQVFCSEVVKGDNNPEAADAHAKLAAKSGFDACDTFALMFVCGRLGLSVMGLFHDSYNDANTGERPILTDGAIRRTLETFHQKFGPELELEKRKG